MIHLSIQGQVLHSDFVSGSRLPLSSSQTIGPSCLPVCFQFAHRLNPFLWNHSVTLWLGLSFLCKPGSVPSPPEICSAAPGFSPFLLLCITTCVTEHLGMWQIPHTSHFATLCRTHTLEVPALEGKHLLFRFCSCFFFFFFSVSFVLILCFNSDICPSVSD